MMNRRLLVAFLLAVTVASAVAADIGRVKVVHAYPTGQLTVDIYILQNGFVAKSLMSVPYKAASDWFYLPYGTYTLQITAAGSTDPVYTTDVTINSYSTVAFAADDGAGALTVSAFNDDISSITTGKARVTIAHFAVGVSAVDVGAGVVTDNLAANLGYGSLSDPVEVDAGTVTAGVRPTGSVAAALLNLTVTLEARKHYLVVAVGDANTGTPAPQLVAFELADYSINARLAFVHGVPANLTVSVVANQVLTLFRNIQYKGITDYKNIPVGTHTIDVVAGASTPISITAFFNGFTESTLYATVGTDSPVGILLADDNTAPASGKTNVRVLHGAGAAPSVDVLSGTTVVVSNITYGFASGYLVLSSGSYSLSVNAAGTSTSVLTVNLNLAAGPIITILAAGDPSKTGIEAFTLIVVTDATYGADGNLRAVHAVAGAPNVNIDANGNQILANVPYKAVSAYLPVPAGLYRVSVNAASGDTELFRSPVRVDAAGYFTAVAGGVGGDLALFQLRDDNSRPVSGNAHLRVVHSSAGSPEVNIEFAGAIVGSLIYTEAFGYVPVPAGSYVARVLAASNSAQVFNGSLTLEADTVVSVFAVGIVGDNTNGFTVLPTIDFDYRAPMAGPDSSAPVASTPSTPTRAPTRTPATSSASYIAASSAVLMTLVALL